LARAYARLNDGEAAKRAIAQARQIGQSARGQLIPLVIAGNQARNAWGGGDLRAVARICKEAMTSLVEPAERAGERLPHACHVYVYLGRTLLEWNELERAEPLLLRGIELAELALEQVRYVDGCRDLALLHWIQQAYDQAHAWMDRAVQACIQDAAYLHALRARIWLAQAEEDPRWLETAIQWADGRSLVASGEYDWELQTLIRVRIAQHRARGEPGLAPILALVDERLANQPISSSGWRVQNLVLKALLLDVLDRRDEAMDPLSRALAISKATGRVMVWLEHGSPMYELVRRAVNANYLAAAETEFALHLLAAFEARGRVRAQALARRELSPPSQAALVERLTERELEVLRWMATTLSGPEIADELSISLSTYRSHTKNIRGKLGAHSRLDAISRAAELGLLPGQSSSTRQNTEGTR
jgi:LuxR family maltose regulon positive regulatory protein